ncbi:glycoside hydrolase family 3 protein [Sphingomonas silueang]|uniref:glycoside hydrolase family 3 protein n=1 Tax=Sphingomonas silueang TaxID=3156617 RepID=UPI0032B5CB04
MAAAGTAAAVAQGSVADVHPARWPAGPASPADPAIEARVAAILARMSIEQKVGQTIQGDIASTTPEDVARYHLGSVLNGGSSSPGGDEFGPASDWVALADAYYAASMRPHGDLPRIPVIWGSDAVHGHNNIVGATLFPHNIGLGAARDPELMRRIGAATAIELRVTGLDWTFAPTVAVARDDRWGRTYESFGEDPAIAAGYAGPLVEGLQGRRGAADWLRGPHVIATAKHFLADGGTRDGRDRGDARLTEAELIRLHAPAYVAALGSGVQAVMASFSSWNGIKMHGNAGLLTGVLKRRWGFDGLVVGDWDGHAKVPGCTTVDCPASMAAGLDMYMAPASWKGLYASTLAAARDGRLPMARLDDAVRRILRVKLRAGLLDAPKPSARPYAGRYELLGAPAHRAVAREAVAKSLVLLKNTGVLPLKSGARLLVAGDAADSVARQSGGWTLTWQGTGTGPGHFPGATTIFAGLRDAARATGGSATLSPDGSFAARPDAAVVVFGEAPYAEFQGDRADLLFDNDAGALATLKRLRAAGVPTVAVFLSGRPMWVNTYLNAADAFVAAWLPGSEGGGVADVLYGRRPFTGRLPMSWPGDARGAPLNAGDPGYRPLYPLGYGLDARRRTGWKALSEDSGVVVQASTTGPLFAAGRAASGRSLRIDGANDSPQAVTGAADNGSVAIVPIDRDRQEDARQVTWSGRARGTLILANDRAQDLSRAGPLAIRVAWRVEAAPTAAVVAELRCGPGCTGRRDVTAALAAAAGKGWTTWRLPLACLPGADLSRVTQPLALTTSGRLRVAIAEIALEPSTGGATACP